MKLARLGAIITVLALCSAGVGDAGDSSDSGEPPQNPAAQHIWVTTGEPPPGNPYTLLGVVTYSEPRSDQATDPTRMAEKLKMLALRKFPEVDALIEEDSEVSADGSTLKVTARAIEYAATPFKKLFRPPPYDQVVSPPV